MESLEHITEEDKNNIIVFKKAYARLKGPYDPKRVFQRTYSIDASFYDRYESVLDNIASDLKQFGFNDENAMDYAYNLGELVLNACEHSYKFEKGKTVDIRLFFMDKYVLSSVQSQGDFDVQRAKCCMQKADVDLLNSKNRGFFLMSAYFDMIYANKNGKDIDMIVGKVNTT